MGAVLVGVGGVRVHLCGWVYLPGRAGDFDPPRLTGRAAPATLADGGGGGETRRRT